MLNDAGHEVFCVDRSRRGRRAIGHRLGTRLHVVGQVESLPFLSCHFDVVTASQTLAPLRPRTRPDRDRPGAQAWWPPGVAYNTRDDTVPWVRRLIALMRQADPDSMRGDFGEQPWTRWPKPLLRRAGTQELPQLGADHPSRADRDGRAAAGAWPDSTRTPGRAAARGRRALRHLGAAPIRCCCRSRRPAGGPTSTIPRLAVEDDFDDALEITL